MLILYLLQAIVPLALIIWLAFAPPSTVGFWVQAIAAGLAFVMIGMVGIWTFPPWWALYALGVFLAGVAVWSLSRRRRLTRWPQRPFEWLSFAGFLALGIYSADVIRLALPAMIAPRERSVDLASPLGPGTYLIANGGAAPSVNAHAGLLDPTVSAHRLYRGTAHGVDLVALDRWGLRADGLMPTDPDRYVIFGRPIIAPCAGKVIAAVDGLPDLQVPQMDQSHLAGNHIILRCAVADILLGHFHKGSVRVRIGQKLVVGDAVAEVGNSGNTSEPHLHINAQERGTVDGPFAGAPIPIRIEGRYLVRNDRFVVSQQPRQL